MKHDKIETSLEILLDNIPTQVWYLTDEHTYGEVNRAHATFNGLTVEDMAFRDMYDFLPREVVDVCREGNRDVFTGKRQLRTEEWVPHASGEPRLISIVKTPKLNANGGVEYVVCSAEDITERKKTEKELQVRSQQQEELVRFGEKALRSSSVDVLFKEAVKLVSRVLETRYAKVLEHRPAEGVLFLRAGVGWKKGWVGKKSVPDGPGSQGGYTLERVKPGISHDVDHEKRFSPPPLLTEHHVVCGLTVAIPGESGPFGILGAHHDKPRRFTENDACFLENLANILAAAIQRFNALHKFDRMFHANPALMAVNTLPDMLFTEVNDTFTRLLGYARDEVIGKRLDELDILPDQESRERAAGVLGNARNVKDLEIRVRTRDGMILDGLLSGAVIESNGSTYFLSVMTDITRLKQAEEAALAAGKSKSEFLANMSHEIRTPLNGVIGFTELLENTSLSPVQRQYLENARASARSLLEIINDILDFSKIEAGWLELEFIKTDMFDLLEECADLLTYPASQKNLELLLDIDPAMPPLALVDPVRLKQILVNLLSNAVKFTERGEIELKVRFHDIGSGRGAYYFSVRDTGIGITEDQQDKLFRAFSQADSSTTRKFGGTGLGLIISDMITRKMGGKIRLDSEFGRGTTFYFEIITEYDGKPEPILKKPGTIRRCLLVDDNRRSLEILENLLSARGIDCSFFENGLEAMKALGSEDSFDLCIIDYDMPCLDGLETVRLIREKLKKPQAALPVVMLHPFSAGKDVHEKCRELGVFATLAKPLNPKKLVDVIAGLVSGATSRLDDVPAEKDARGHTPVDLPAGETRKILVAEDNRMNMMIAKSFIAKAVPSVEILEAVNGEEALAAVKKHRPDMIFMDMQMPVIDGVEATLRIREFERQTFGHIPIVALTAGALESEREKSLHAGMDDFLTKPLDRKRLRGVLETYLGAGKGASDEGNSAAGESVGQFDEAALLEKVEDDTDLLAALKEAALADMPKKIQDLHKAVEADDAEQVGRVAHGIKGAALNMCFTRLADLAWKVEKDTEDRIEHHVRSLCTDIDNEWQSLAGILSI